MSGTTTNNFHKNMTEEKDERLFYALMLMGMPDHIHLKDPFFTEEVSSDLVSVGPYGIWLCGNDYLGGVIYEEDGVYLREKEDVDSEGKKVNTIEYLEEVEARWWTEKEAVEEVLSSLFPKLFEHNPLLIRGGVCLAQHDNGVNRTFPAAFGLDEELEDMNNDLGCPCDIYGHPIEPILTENQVEAIAGALLGNSLNVMRALSELFFEIVFSDQEKEEMRSYHGDPDGLVKCVERIADKRDQETPQDDDN